MSLLLDVRTLPLWGSRLIEASAGTGKTWTLAALVLRLVLGHGGANAFARPLQPAQILVMTFTRAATRELSARIRARLLQAARCFDGQELPAADDLFMQQLLGEYPPGAPRTQAAWQLALAAEAMDDAAVHTIDAWCQRMLREHAFDSGSPFDDVLDVDETGMRREAALDYWRQQVYPLDDAALSQVLAVWPSAHALVGDAQRLLEQPLPDAAGQGTLAALIEEQSAQRRQLKLGWAERARQMEHWLDHLGPGSVVAKARLQPRHYKSWLAVLSAWADDPPAELLEMRIGAERLTPHGLADVLHPAVELPPHFAELAALVQALARLPSPTAARRAHAAVTISRRLAVMKARAGTFGFADMLNRLDAALDPACNSAAARLRARIREQFPVALIDEFQDTSPVQARIFDRLYGIADNDPATGLLLIGDPKQSIYGFRGADIHAYLAARRATEGRRYVLGVNHRSTAALVDAVNALFARADSQLEGAFMFRPAGAPPIDDPLPFEPVQAHGRKQQFVCSARADGPAALAFELDDRLLDAGSSQREFAARCAEHIVQLLNDERAGFRDHQSGAFTRLASADIAVLVRTRRQAADVRRELARRHVPSVYLSDGDSVFAGDEARDLLHWLRAVAAPGNSRLVRAALATAMLGLTIDELRQLAEDDAAYDSRATELRRLRAVWQQQGVLSMLRQTLHSIGAPARWLASDGRRDGERRLTNHLHLAELLQAASAQHPGEQSLIRWLSQQREALMVDGDERIVRLESDAELVKVVTVHKAKGLQYPLVFLPFACHFRAVRKSRDEIVVLHDAGGQRQAHLDPAPQQIEAAERERLREDLRLLYVATTRAEHHLWIGLAALKSGTSQRCVWHRSAIGYALSGPEDMAAEALRNPVEALVRSSDRHTLELTLAPPIEQLPRTTLLPRAGLPPLRAAAPYAADFDRQWSIGSYSSLVRTLAAPGASSAAVALARDDEHAPPAAHASPTPPVTAAGEPWHVLTPGAGTGTVLHALLEQVAADGLDRIDDDDLRRQLLRRCQQMGYGAQAQQLLAWLAELLRTPLPPLGVALGQVDRVLSEMEFWLPSARLQSSRIDVLCRAHLLGAAPRPALPPRTLHGMVMGFADLVFEHRGRYWVLDYKSNRLAPDDAGYDADTLVAAMAAHRYDAQAALYLVALHRLLRERLGRAYDPHQHLGGALFFFVRGLRGPQRGCVHLPAPQALLDGLDAALDGGAGAP